MFVCHGNICRSPTAEFVMKDIISKSKCKEKFTVSSCATSTEEIYNGMGNLIYPPAKAELERHGISCDGKRAVQLQKSDYGKYDLFVGMDSANVRNMYRIFGSDPDGTICKLMDFTERGGDVADPWYSGRFDIAFCDIREGCLALFERLVK